LEVEPGPIDEIAGEAAQRRRRAPAHAAIIERERGESSVGEVREPTPVEHAGNGHRGSHEDRGVGIADR
jgi:hypothetical protein